MTDTFSTTAILAENVCVKTTSNLTLVEPISFKIETGQALTILGETGSGKSLLAQALMGALPEGLITEGTIYIDNTPTSPKDIHALWGKRLAMLAQEPTRSLDPTMNILEQTAEGYRFVANLDKTTAHQKSQELLSTLGLGDYHDYYPHELSGGMAQRVAFCVASSGGATIVLADEPTKGLDDKNRQIVIDLLCRIVQNGGTLLTITHDIDVATALCQTDHSRLMVMKKGMLLEEGDGKTLIQSPQSDYAKKLISCAPSNWQMPIKSPITTDVQVSLDNIAIKRGKKTLFEGLNLQIHQGETIGIVGRSGIGKSSLGDVICGLLPPSQGKITWTTPPKRHHVLKLYQDPPSAFAPHLPLQVLLDDVINKHALDRSRIPYLLDKLSLNPALLSRTADNVSGGELQRIAILRCLLLNPVLLFADEVTSRLDPITQQETMDLLVEQCKENNCTLILVSHDPHLTEYYCDTKVDLSEYCQ